ncbi:MAG: ribosome small subunit-dependent GTPase A [Proteobacteria bacterium]|nr:ribosome small subunit-dependent GTPase A [Pseudomonadota bacterium]
MIFKQRIISTYKNTAKSLDLDSGEKSTVFFPRRMKPICGDYVNISDNKYENRIEQIKPRFNTFCRADQKGRRQHMAANIDQLLIVLAVAPAPTRDIINRYLVAAEHDGIDAVLIFNKSDLDLLFFVNKINLYERLGYTTLKTSIKEDQSVYQIKDVLKDKTSVVVGQSGVGKSSLSQILLPEVEFKTAKLSDKTGKGSHTTSVTQLYNLPELNAYLIDSPGVWEYGLWEMDALQLASGFREFFPFVGNCKFSNCTHIHEPECAIVDQVKQKKINQKRYESYLRIVDSMKYWK